MHVIVCHLLAKTYCFCVYYACLSFLIVKFQGHHCICWFPWYFVSLSGWCCHMSFQSIWRHLASMQWKSFQSIWRRRQCIGIDSWHSDSFALGGFRDNSVVAWSAIQDEKGGLAHCLFFLSCFLSWLLSLGLCTCCGRSLVDWSDWHVCTSRNVKSVALLYIMMPYYFLYLYSWEVRAITSPCMW